MNVSLSSIESSGDSPTIEQRVNALLLEMTLAEKIGQLSQVNAAGDDVAEHLRENL